MHDPISGEGRTAAVRRRTLVAVYAEVDMNLVDGSSVWVQSICQVLASLPDVTVSLLLRGPERRALLIDPLRSSAGIEILEPRDLGHAGRLSPEAAAAAIEGMVSERGVDLVLLRGRAVSTAATRRRSLRGRIWTYHLPGSDGAGAEFAAVAEASRHVLCQTEAVRASLEAVAPAHAAKLILLPPMIPEPAASELRPMADRALESPKLVYSGKVSPEYGFFAMVDLLELLRGPRPGAELHVVGDKIHDPPADRSFQPEARRRLEETPGLVWHGGVERSRVQEILREADFALSMRDAILDQSLELSTKLLEYGAAGLPTLLNRTPAHEQLLGADYPLFAASARGGFEAIEVALADQGQWGLAAERCARASRSHSFREVAKRLEPYLREATRRSPVGGPGARRIVMAGHDFKFAEDIGRRVESLGAEVRRDRWRGHAGHSEPSSAELLAWADTVFCEWCLGNAAYYSRSVSPEQRLVVRFHRMELETAYPSQMDLDRVSSMVFVSEHVLDSAAERFSWPKEKLRVIPNAVDLLRLDRPKLEGAAFNIALIGFVPILKRLDRALDVLEVVRAHDTRFRLILKGHEPAHYPWVMKRASERAFFREQYERIATSPLLRGAVTIEPFGDVPSFLRKVGLTLSTSDYEGHQVSIAECMASGTVPVILDRAGAGSNYSDRWVHASVDAAATFVLETTVGERLREESVASAEHAARWSYEAVLPAWDDLLGGRAVLEERAGTGTAPISAGGR